MFWLYLALGVLLTALLHVLILGYSRMSSQTRSSMQELLARGGILALFWWLIRRGLQPLAGAYGFLLLLLPFLASPRRESGKGPSSGVGLSESEARDILGVEAGASAEDIQEAYHRLMMQHHPDKGGSDYFARKLNEARDRLLGR